MGEPLLPCPCCGSVAERIDAGPGRGDHIECTHCDLRMPDHALLAGSSVTRWNRRPTPTDPTGERVDGKRIGAMAVEYMRTRAACAETDTDQEQNWMLGHVATFGMLVAEAAPLERDAALALVNEQAEDPGLWFMATTITEDMLQRALRRLHAAIEGPSTPPREPDHG